MTALKPLITALAIGWLALFLYRVALEIHDHQVTVAERLSAEHARRIDNMNDVREFSTQPGI
tara:strand:- start:1 stop:186 length:186 start_codon:yes stop_codon:yes gene_type:complete